jgi:hypothetical protein
MCQEPTSIRDQGHPPQGRRLIEKRRPISSAAAFVSQRENQSCDMPPSTTNSDPVMKEELSLARNTATLAIVSREAI